MRYALVFALAASWTANAHGEEAEPGVLREPGRTVVGQAASARENSRGAAGMFGVDGRGQLARPRQGGSAKAGRR